MKIEVSYKNTDSHRLWTVTMGDKSADHLDFAEMLALFISLTAGERDYGLQWMITDQQRKEENNNIPMFTNEETGEVGKMIRK